MLVLSRCPGEGVEIFDEDLDLLVEVGWIRGDRVRLIIEAPPGVLIIRGELPLDFKPERRGGRLVLTRTGGEGIRFNTPEGGVLGELTVVGFRGTRARLGFEFAPGFRILRKELSDPTPPPKTLGVKE